jgi:hypothetical protein
MAAATARQHQVDELDVGFKIIVTTDSLNKN